MEDTSKGLDAINIQDNSDQSIGTPPSSCETKIPGLQQVRGPSAKIEIRASPVHGYGIFAKEKIEAGELIEEARLLALKFRTKYSNDPILKDYAWTDQSCSCDECQKHGLRQYIALGFGSLYNHSDKSNTIQDMDFKREIMSVRARNVITKGEEIFLYYGELYWVLRKFWNDLPDEAIDKLIAMKKSK